MSTAERLEQFKELLKEFKDLDPRLQSVLEGFEKLDQNGDGFLTREEIKEFFKKTGQKWRHSVDEKSFAKTDKDGDGKISIAEFVKRSEKADDSD